jgi:hypothetical protein
MIAFHLASPSFGTSLLQWLQHLAHPNSIGDEKMLSFPIIGYGAQIVAQI